MTANRGRWAWAAISTLGYVASAFGGFVAAWVLEDGGAVDAPGLDAHGLGLTSQVAIWGILSAFVVVAAARLLLEAPLRISPGAITVLGGGLIVASMTQYTLYEWVIPKFGYYDPEYIGWTFALPGAVVAVAVAGFAAWAAPRQADGLPPLIALATAAAGVGFIVASNVGGLSDGIRSASVPLAILVGAAGAFTVIVLVLASERQRRVASAGAGNRNPS